jgi:hypothetical protein
MWRLACVSALTVCVCICGCAVAFTAGGGDGPKPPKFQDPDTSAHHETEKEEAGKTASVPTVGMSLVVGGEKLDAGLLPKPPIPVVLLP